MQVDVLIVGGQVCDGSGSPLREECIGISGDRITYMGKEQVEARRVIDAASLVVAPGFIDMHVHSDLAIIVDPQRESQVAQGVTTEVVGQDGLGYAPMSAEISERLIDAMTAWNGRLPDGINELSVEDYLALIDDRSRLNVAYLIPHGTIRMNVMGFDDRHANEDELEQMRGLLRSGLQAGAFGLSTGLTYAPAMYADDVELIRLNEVVAEVGGVYVPHHRNYGSGALRAYEECVDIAEASGVRLHLTHAHLGFPANRGKARTLLEMLEAAESRGVRVSLDAYPYGPAATSLVALLPPWMHQLSHQEFISVLIDEETLSMIGDELVTHGTVGHMCEPVDWNRVIVASVASEHLKAISGLSVVEIARLWELDPIHAVARVLLMDNLHTGVIVDIGNEENVDAIVTSRFHTGSSDGMFVGDRPHPRGFGSHARLISNYVRERGLMRLEEMVHHITGSAAQVLGLHERGVLEVGNFADIAIFDMSEFSDQATFESPRVPSKGMHTVLVNGEVVLDAGVPVDGVPGRALRRRSSAKVGV